MNRRDFLKRLCAGTAAIGVASLTGCDSGSPENMSDVEIGSMTLSDNTSTHDKVSLLGYGMMRLPMLEKEEGSEGQDIDQETVNELVSIAMRYGVNYYDTSPVYCQGKSEASTGEALSKFPRDKYFVATKLSNFDPSTQTYDGSVGMYHDSMRYLRVDYIDYYLLHAIGRLDDFYRRFVDNGVMDFLLEERKAGRIRNLGFSFHGPRDSFEELMRLHEKYHWDFVQLQLNYSDWKTNRDTAYEFNLLREQNISVVIMEPLLGGRLAKVPEVSMVEMKRREPDRSVASWAFRFCGSLPNVLTCLSGMTYKEHLEDNIMTFSPLCPLDGEEKAFLSTVVDEIFRNPGIPCTGCQYCMPCPYGLDIPGIFAYYNGHKDETSRFVGGYNAAVEPVRQADHCVACNECVSHCPQHINIPEQMLFVDKFVEAIKRQTL